MRKKTRKKITHEWFYLFSELQFFLLISTIILAAFSTPFNLNLFEIRKKWLTMDKKAMTKSMFFGVHVHNDSKTQEILYWAWINQMHQQTKNEVIFFDLTRYNPKIPVKVIPVVPYYCTGQELINLVEPQYLGKEFRLNAVKILTATKYFLYETEHEWFWSMSENCQVDYSNINNIINDLDEKYDTGKDIVFQGQCSHCWKYYIKGECGMIMSRRAAKLFLEYGQQWIEFIDAVPEDIELSHFIKEAGLSTPETQSPYMLSHLITFPIHNQWYLNKLSDCPSNPSTDQCQSSIYPISLFSAYGTQYFNHRNKTMKLIREAREYNPSIHYYFNNQQIFFCLNENQSQINHV